MLQFLALHQKVAWAARMNTGALKIDKRLVRFGFAGCSDIIGQMKDGRFLAIECKTKSGKMTDAQREFLLLVYCHRGVAGIARSVEDARLLVEET